MSTLLHFLCCPEHSLRCACAPCCSYTPGPACSCIPGEMEKGAQGLPVLSNPKCVRDGSASLLEKAGFIAAEQLVPAVGELAGESNLLGCEDNVCCSFSKTNLAEVRRSSSSVSRAGSSPSLLSPRCCKTTFCFSISWQNMCSRIALHPLSSHLPSRTSALKPDYSQVDFFFFIFVTVLN